MSGEQNIDELLGGGAALSESEPVPETAASREAVEREALFERARAVGIAPSGLWKAWKLATVRKKVEKAEAEAATPPAAKSKKKKAAKPKAPPSPREAPKIKLDFDKPYETIASLEPFPDGRVFHQYGVYFDGTGNEVARDEAFNPEKHSEEAILATQLTHEEVEVRVRYASGEVGVDRQATIEQENAKAAAAERLA